jgi:hypothetical protein
MGCDLDDEKLHVLEEDALSISLWRDSAIGQKASVRMRKGATFEPSCSYGLPSRVPSTSHHQFQQHLENIHKL